MAVDINADDYDEDSVFNRLFAKDKAKPRPNHGDRLEKLFSETKAPEAPINVQDFLPRY